MDGVSRTQRTSMIDFSGGFRLESGNRLSLKGCFNGCDGEFRKTDTNQTNYRKIDDRFKKANAVAPYQQLLHDSDVGLGEVKNVELMNGLAGCEHGSPLGFPKRPMHEKLVVAVDVDEVLGSFLSALNEFIADRYSSNHSVSEYYVYEFCKIWKCSRNEADIRVHEFFKTAYFKAGIHPIPGAHHALKRLSSFCSLSVVTSRQNAIKDHTIEWIEKHYPGVFQEIHFGNHFALDGQSRPKSEICRSLGAQVLIDDNPRYAIECAEAGIKVLLFDYNDSYPWCKTGSGTPHPLVTKVYNWHEVERHLASLVMS
ncbi:hypothetical protein MRB53_029774 [Persea americana]|uniref:Uncharacterized protein n=1 Tax=Persea americana TaxID=3435 RepID=A0ACC2KJ89_PERAE|nr:hypothetical protein MRB53_029774 [Persea americana]